MRDHSRKLDAPRIRPSLRRPGGLVAKSRRAHNARLITSSLAPRLSDHGNTRCFGLRRRPGTRDQQHSTTWPCGVSIARRSVPVRLDLFKHQSRIRHSGSACAKSAHSHVVLRHQAGKCGGSALPRFDPTTIAYRRFLWRPSFSNRAPRSVSDPLYWRLSVRNLLLISIAPLAVCAVLYVLRSRPERIGCFPAVRPRSTSLTVRPAHNASKGSRAN